MKSVRKGVASPFGAWQMDENGVECGTLWGKVGQSGAA
jgi:hypothetical protein